MSFHVAFSEKAKKQLKNLNKLTASLITGWIRKNLEGCDDPQLYGKSLTANQIGQWRYRVGNYRILADIQDGKIIILVVTKMSNTINADTYGSDSGSAEIEKGRKQENIQ